jgi:hypothetical protein
VPEAVALTPPFQALEPPPPDFSKHWKKQARPFPSLGKIISILSKARKISRLFFQALENPAA